MQTLKKLNNTELSYLTDISSWYNKIAVTSTMSDNYIGFQNMSELMALNDMLSAKTIDQVNENQQLKMMNTFSKETNEHVINNSLKHRLSEIESWSWVLQDLSKRLEDALQALKYEEHSVVVVIDRIDEEISAQGMAVTKPGVLCPLTDSVEEAVMQEHNFLTKQRKMFCNMLTSIEKQIKTLQNIKQRIDEDIIKKKKAITVEEKLMKDPVTCCSSTSQKKRKKKLSCDRWENRCMTLKKSGLAALNDALVARQQVRGARAQLSIMSEAHLSRVDAAIRRRLHANKSKLNELQWQREEAVRDYNSLAEELATAEKSLLETMDQTQKIEKKISERSHKPKGERLRDDVDAKLRSELGRSRSFGKEFSENIKRIESLQNNLVTFITNLDSAAQDLSRVIELDVERLENRQGDRCSCDSENNDVENKTSKLYSCGDNADDDDDGVNFEQSTSTGTHNSGNYTSKDSQSNILSSIKEENESDDE